METGPVAGLVAMISVPGLADARAAAAIFAVMVSVVLGLMILMRIPVSGAARLPRYSSACRKSMADFQMFKILSTIMVQFDNIRGLAFREAGIQTYSVSLLN